MSNFDTTGMAPIEKASRFYHKFDYFCLIITPEDRFVKVLFFI